MTAAQAESDDGGARISRRAEAWAWEAINAYGQALDGDLVQLPCSQAELSERFGWPRNDGRVAAYLRDLGPVVVRRRGGIVLDRRLLGQLGDGDRPTLETDRSAAGNLYLLPPPAAVGEREAALRRRLVEIDRQLLDLLWEQRTVLRTLVDGPTSQDPLAILQGESTPRTSSAKTAEVRGTPRTQDREVRGFDPEVQPQTLTSLSSHADSARESATDPRHPAGDGRDWADGDLFELLRDLIAACEARGLPGLNNPAGALEALRSYSRSQVKRAQAQVANQVLGGQSLSNPIGLLVSAARSNNPGYFPPPSGPPPPPPVIDEPADDPLELDAAAADHEALAAIRALESTPQGEAELMALDEAVRAEILATGLSPVMMRSASTLRPLRARAWRMSTSREAR